jgi:hypothetical protein
MRHTTTATAAAVLLLALTACSTTADNPPSSASPKPGQNASTEQPSTPPADDSKAKLEQAVRDYSAAYFATDTAKAYGMLSQRCAEEIPAAMYGPMVEATVKQYGVHDIKTLTVDQVSGDLARVTYTYPVPALDQKQQPWAREDGQWRYDAC